MGLNWTERQFLRRLKRTQAGLAGGTEPAHDPADDEEEPTPAPPPPESVARHPSQTPPGEVPYA